MLFLFFFLPVDRFKKKLNQFLYTQLLAGLAIVLGIPFPIWIYYKGEEMRARNPLTRASVKKSPSQESGLGT